jgi:hypothetical protein
MVTSRLYRDHYRWYRFLIALEALWIALGGFFVPKAKPSTPKGKSLSWTILDKGKGGKIERLLVTYHGTYNNRTKQTTPLDDATIAKFKASFSKADKLEAPGFVETLVT